LPPSKKDIGRDTGIAELPPNWNGTAAIESTSVENVESELYMKVTVDVAFPAITVPLRTALYAVRSVTAVATGVGLVAGAASVVKEPTWLRVLPDSFVAEMRNE
jgi:hypothetical protein